MENQHLLPFMSVHKYMFTHLLLNDVMPRVCYQISLSFKHLRDLGRLIKILKAYTLKPYH